MLAFPPGLVLLRAGLLTRFGHGSAAPAAPAKAMLFCSRMQVGEPLPDAPDISGPGLEGNKSISSAHAKVNLPSVLSPLRSPDLSSPMPNVDTTASRPITHCTPGPHEFLHGFIADI